MKLYPLTSPTDHFSSMVHDSLRTRWATARIGATPQRIMSRSGQDVYHPNEFRSVESQKGEVWQRTRKSTDYDGLENGENVRLLRCWHNGSAASGSVATSKSHSHLRLSHFFSSSRDPFNTHWRTLLLATCLRWRSSLIQYNSIIC